MARSNALVVRLILSSVAYCSAFGGMGPVGRQHPMMQGRPGPPGRRRSTAMISDLNRANWCQNVDGVENLAVVFFYARWCRNCKAVKPIFARMEREYGEAAFFQVNFKAERELCYQERVFSFPVVHFYLPGVGRVGRCVLTVGDAEPRLRHQLDRLLNGQEGKQLRLVQQHSLTPVVKYKELVSALGGLAQMSMLSGAAPNAKMAGLQQTVEADEARLADLEALFGWLDRDSAGRLSLRDLEAAVAALRPAGGGADGGDAASMLLRRIREQSAGGSGFGVDLATFVELMRAKAVAEYTSPEKELLPAFEAIDMDGDGVISREQMLLTIDNFCTSLPEADGCELGDMEDLPTAIDAFADAEQLLDYERFVEMVSGRTKADVCEIGEEDESYQSIFGAI